MAKADANETQPSITERLLTVALKDVNELIDLVEGQEPTFSDFAEAWTAAKFSFVHMAHANEGLTHAMTMSAVTNTFLHEVLSTEVKHILCGLYGLFSLFKTKLRDHDFRISITPMQWQQLKDRREFCKDRFFDAHSAFDHLWRHRCFRMVAASTAVTWQSIPRYEGERLWTKRQEKLHVQGPCTKDGLEDLSSLAQLYHDAKQAAGTNASITNPAWPDSLRAAKVQFATDREARLLKIAQQAQPLEESDDEDDDLVAALQGHSSDDEINDDDDDDDDPALTFDN
eukprot:TRINITY_DN8913_c0_g1_i5.p1 TRINITY_DN8913_c0_g1~~TRINITY_DN8913_c0_g1_i5.p1  ORF type:complete len:285 (+),score=65.40 TRINITY_DN8913_c0_g1_i5:36-890(+)